MHFKNHLNQVLLNSSNVYARLARALNQTHFQLYTDEENRSVLPNLYNGILATPLEYVISFRFGSLCCGIVF